MGCSDTYAEALAARDPEFRARNDHNSKTWVLERHHVAAMCDWGKEAFAGHRPNVEPLERISRPVGNGYLDADTAVSAEMGTWRTEPVESHINRAADAADSLAQWLRTGKGGEAAFEWLIEHWGFDLSRIVATNERHQRELLSLTPASPKAIKRRELLKVDVPEAELIAKRIAWAKEQRGLC